VLCHHVDEDVSPLIFALRNWRRGTVSMLRNGPLEMI
jgi:hypothetical protein